jgi:hypothetical protein
MLSAKRIHRLAISLLALSAISALTSVANAQQTETIDTFIKCAVYDHEIFQNVIAYQKPID